MDILLSSLAEADLATAATIIDGLARGWPNDKHPRMTADFEATLEDLATTLPPESRGQLVRLAGKWGSKKLDKLAAEITTTLLASVSSEKASVDQRIKAAQQLVEFQPQDDRVAERLVTMITPQTPPRNRPGGAARFAGE